MTTGPRPDRVFIATWTVILAVLCIAGNAIAWALQRLWERWGDAIMAHADWIFATVACASVVAVLWLKIGEE